MIVEVIKNPDTVLKTFDSNVKENQGEMYAYFLGIQQSKVISVNVEFKENEATVRSVADLFEGEGNPNIIIKQTLILE